MVEAVPDGETAPATQVDDDTDEPLPAPAAPPISPWGFLIPMPPNKSPVISLNSAMVMFGKGKDATLRFDDPRISVTHCQLFRVPTNGNVHLLDLSRNGTFVNGVLVGKGGTKDLHSGDQISLIKSKPGEAVADSACTPGCVPRASHYPFLFQSGGPAQRPAPPRAAQPRLAPAAPQLLRGTSLYSPQQAADSSEREYEEICELGRGSFAVVKKVRHRKTGMLYALKAMDKRRLMKGGSARLQANQKEVLSEARILKSMSHPGIIKFHDIFETELELCLVMELVEGGELFDHLYNHGPFSERDARDIMHQLLQALHYLHSKHIVHRDLKPENILLQRGQSTTEDGAPAAPRIKIADFGLAKLVGTDKVTSTFCGTPQYFAPEVLESRNSHRGYDDACDMWSVGVLLYILLSGSPPFSEEKAQHGGLSIYEQIKEGISPSHFDGTAWAHISTGAKQLVRGLLVVDPRRRLSVEKALQHAWMRGVPVEDEASGASGARSESVAPDDIEECDSDDDRPSNYTPATGGGKKTKRQRVGPAQQQTRSVVPPLQTHSRQQNEQQLLQPPPPTQAAFKAPTLIHARLAPPPKSRVPPAMGGSTYAPLRFMGGGV
ncbi:hypothetical protein AB1Y20_017570 [Prymnesium parvum]|uniref:Non-specific serine/threonine protein kinase n=1 Tax=Prymnesium parvum TaxID=97485 RepID=A0AB34JKL5_PRYPA